MYHIFVTGGVCSGLGKGITAASLGRLLKNRGFKIKNQKFDPYMNHSAGTMNPTEHGECFVTEDGFETDLDIGHYTRFTDEKLDRRSSITSGQVYRTVLDNEMKGFYKGKTVQIIHIINEVKRQFTNFKDEEADIIIHEIGGTVGDMESQIYLEAVRQFIMEDNKGKRFKNSLLIHVALLPYISGSNELKSKPAQHSVRDLQAVGLIPDILVCRADSEVDKEMKEKLAMFCSVSPEDIIINKTSNILYEVPLLLREEGIIDRIVEKFNFNLDLVLKEDYDAEWEYLINKIKKSNNSNKVVNIAIVGKYLKLMDSYLSIIESLKFGAWENEVKLNFEIVNTELLTSYKKCEVLLDRFDGIIVPGGFGHRLTEGMINAIEYARKNDKPFLGICLGMQMAVVEFARNVCKISDASSEEFELDSNNYVINYMNGQKYIQILSNTMRLGSFKCEIKKDTQLSKIYNKDSVNEIHRHRLEFNNNYKSIFEEKGLVLSGVNNDLDVIEAVEFPNNKFHIGVQYHPELNSTPLNPNPLFVEFIKSIKNN